MNICISKTGRGILMDRIKELKQALKNIEEEEEIERIENKIKKKKFEKSIAGRMWKALVGGK